MSNSEAYDAGFHSGRIAANFAVAYANASNHDDAPDVTDYRGYDATTQQRWDFERGYEDGWNHYMREDYPE